MSVSPTAMRAARLASGLSLEQAALTLEMPANYLRHIERGQEAEFLAVVSDLHGHPVAPLGGGRLERAAALYGVAAESLLVEPGEPNRTEQGVLFP